MKSRSCQWLVEGLRLRGFQPARLGAFLIVPILAACNEATGPSRLVSIIPASQSVAIQPTVHGPTLSVSLTLTNTSHNPIYYWPCGVALQRLVNGGISVSGGDTWQVVWSPICTAELVVPPPTLQPGESVTIPITAIVSTGANLPLFDGAPGLYRARFSLATTVLGFTRQLSEDESSSAGFTVVAN